MKQAELAELLTSAKNASLEEFRKKFGDFITEHHITLPEVINALQDIEIEGKPTISLKDGAIVVKQNATKDAKINLTLAVILNSIIKAFEVQTFSIKDHVKIGSKEQELETIQKIARTLFADLSSLQSLHLGSVVPRNKEKILHLPWQDILTCLDLKRFELQEGHFGLDTKVEESFFTALKKYEHLESLALDETVAFNVDELAKLNSKLKTLYFGMHSFLVKGNGLVLANLLQDQNEITKLVVYSSISSNDVVDILDGVLKADSKVTELKLPLAEGKKIFINKVGISRAVSKCRRAEPITITNLYPEADEAIKAAIEMNKRIYEKYGQEAIEPGRSR